MKLEKGLFKLTKEQIETSKMLYNDKIIKCLVAPYHSHEGNDYNFVTNKIEMDWADNIYMFPEKDLSEGQTRQFMSLVANGTHQEVLIITASQNIILDMFDGCVRILTEFDEIVECGEKTFGANIHTINHSILNNKSHQKSENSSYGNDFYVKNINNLIDKLNKNAEFTQAEHKTLKESIDRIGEDLIRHKLNEMLRDKKIIGISDKQSEINRLTAELEKLQERQDKLK